MSYKYDNDLDVSELQDRMSEVKELISKAIANGYLTLGELLKDRMERLQKRLHEYDCYLEVNQN